MKPLYLTIDDSPGPRTDDLCGWLGRREIPAVLFIRGARMAENPGPVIRAIREGFVIGNHLYSHSRASRIGEREIIGEIEATEALIDRAYAEAGRPRAQKLMRFPHLDRGSGGWIVDFEAAGRHRERLMRLFTDGLNISLDPPTPENCEKKARLQEYLRREGYAQPFAGITHDWFTQTEMAGARDCLYTYSTADWMLTPRHRGRDWPFKTLEDLKAKIDADPALADPSGADVVLAHDDREDLYDVTTSLIEHFLQRGFSFQSL